ncbi:MAG TPA: type II secretion system F family protein [Gaiellales bacterium]|jgi:tight adherence protein C
MTLLLLGLGCVGLAIVLLLRALALPRARTAQTLEQIPAYGYVVAPEAAAGASPVRTAVDRLANSFGERMFGRVNEKMRMDMRAQLMGAGMYDTSPAKLLGYRVLGTVALMGLAVWLGVVAQPPFVLTLAFIALAFYIGWFGPLTVVRSRARNRFAAIDRSLPDLVDLLVVTVEGGLSFNASLKMASQHVDGPLGAELRLTLREQSLGLSSEEALRNLLLRCDTPGVRAFVRAVLQGEQLGVSIGQIMRNLARESRLLRKATAEERAQKAPIKMLFPLIFLIFPAMFVVLMFPSFYTFAQTFHHVHH